MLAERSRKCGVLCSQHGKHCVKLKRVLIFCSCQLITFYYFKMNLVAILKPNTHMDTIRCTFSMSK